MKMTNICHWPQVDVGTYLAEELSCDLHEFIAFFHVDNVRANHGDEFLSVSCGFGDHVCIPMVTDRNYRGQGFPMRNVLEHRKQSVICDIGEKPTRVCTPLYQLRDYCTTLRVH